MNPGRKSRPAHHVGRVGALAIFLGVGMSGGAITGLPAVAAADTGTPSDTNVSAGGADSSSATPARQSRGARGDSADGAANGAPVTSGADGAVRGSMKQDRANSSADDDRGEKARKSSATRPVPGSDAITSAVAVPERATTESAVVERDSVRTSVLGGPDFPSLGGESDAATAVVVDQEITPLIASSAPAAPVMVAATVRGALSGTPGNPIAWLGGNGDPLAPFAAPLAWATLAVSRREFAGPARTAAPAAAVSTGEPVAAVSTSEPVAVVSSPLADLLGQADAQAAIFAAAKQFVLTVVAGGNEAAALQTGLQSLDVNPLFANYAWDSVLADPGMAQALGGTVGSLITGLAADSEIRSAIGERVSGYLTAALGSNPAAAGIAATVSAAVVGLLADPAAGAGLGAVGGTAVTVLLSQPGAVAALENVKDQIGALVGGSNPAGAAEAAWQSLQADPAFRDAVGVAVTAAVSAGLTNTALVQALGTAVTDVVAGVVDDSALQALAGEQIAGYLSVALAGTPAAGIAPALTDVIVGLISNPAVTGAIADVAGSVLVDLLGQPGIAATVAGIAGQSATALLAGADPEAVLAAAWQGLQADSAFDPAVVTTVANAVNVVLTDSDLVAALGAGTAVLVSAVTADPSVWTFITDLVGSTYGDTIVATLTDLAASGGLADLASSAVTGFLGAPGVAAALSETAGQITAAVLAGAPLTDALQSALASLQAAPVIVAALDAIASDALRSILGEPSVQEAVSAVARDFVTTLVGGSLGDSGLDTAAGQVTEAVVDFLLANTAVQDLISELAVDIAGGTPAGELTNTVIQAVIDQPALQAAVGMAVGQAIGALFGNNPIGFVVGQVVGAAATLLIGAASGLMSLFSLFGFAPPWAPATAAVGPVADGYRFELSRV
ncbi:MAG: hypothetical protein WEB51_06015 [Mycobacterium sp.]